MSLLFMVDIRLLYLKMDYFTKNYFPPEFVIDLQSNLKNINFTGLILLVIFDLGFWYRHTRFLDANNGSPQDAFVIVVGVEKNNLRFGYSYDFNISILLLSLGS